MPDPDDQARAARRRERKARRQKARASSTTYWGTRALLALLSPLPWNARLAVAGAIGRTALRWVPRLRARVSANLAHVMPELGPAEQARIAAEVGDTFGRTALELFASDDFRAAEPWNPPTGEGLAAIEAALEAGKGAVFVSGHYGGWEAIRAWLQSRGRPCATVYRPLGDARLNAFYEASVVKTGGPVLPKGRLAVRTLVRHLARGGFVALLVDQHERRAPALDFLGRPAPTTTVPAELALKFDVPLIPAYAPRTPDGRRIDVRFDAPIPRGTATEMMQAVNHSIAAQVRALPGQYYWLHRRWSKALPGFAEPDRERRRRRKGKKIRQATPP